MKKPDFLNKGDKVAIVCPASFIDDKLDSAISTLNGWGLKVILGSTVQHSFHTFAGSDEQRASDFQQYLDDPNIKAIFAARGGYGCVRMVDLLNFDVFTQFPKWIIGFSDITVLHSHIHSCYGIPTIHGQMPVCFQESSMEGLTTLHAALFGENHDINFQQTISPNRKGTSRGVLIGGNLSLLHSLIGSISDPDYTGKILFIEDVGEQHYNVDRMLWTLKRANKLSKLSGLIIGGFTELRDTDPNFGQNTDEIIMDKVREYDYPVVFHFPAGHISDNRALVMGSEITLTVDNTEATITYSI